MESRGAFDREAWRTVRRGGFKRLFDREGRSDATTLIRSRKPCSTSLSMTMGRLSWIGKGAVDE